MESGVCFGIYLIDSCTAMNYKIKKMDQGLLLTRLNDANVKASSLTKFLKKKFNN